MKTRDEHLATVADLERQTKAAGELLLSQARSFAPIERAWLSRGQGGPSRSGEGDAYYHARERLGEFARAYDAAATDLERARATFEAQYAPQAQSGDARAECRCYSERDASGRLHEARALDCPIHGVGISQ